MTDVYALAEFLLLGVLVVMFINGAGTFVDYVKNVLSENILILIF